MRVIVDCNVFISANIGKGVCYRVFHSVIAAHEWIVTPDILQEYLAVAERKKFALYKKYLTRSLILVSQNTVLVHPENNLNPKDFPDPKDVMYLEAAVASDADILITGNIKHFPELYGKTKIITPRAFLSTDIVA